MKISISIVLLLVLEITVGCSRIPDNYPEVYPCRVTVLNEGACEAGVRVTLYPNFPSGSLQMSGVTDDSGVCVISTTLHGHTKPGAPEGEYIAVLEKFPELTDPMPKKEFDKLLPIQKMAYNEKLLQERLKLPRIIPEKYADSGTSPLKFRVEKPGGGSIKAEIQK